MKSMLLRSGLIGALLLSTGCYRMTIVNNGAIPASSPVRDSSWRSATALDLVKIDSALALDLDCKETGWAKFDQELTPLDWLADVFLAGGLVYESTHVDVYCAKAAPPPPPPPPAPVAAPELPPPAPVEPPPPPAKGKKKK